jgi:3-methyladenine DNA glycosylase/8-oxoguanine DNA glycosylase
VSVSRDAVAVTRRWVPDFPLDMRLTLGPLRRGGGDPTHRVEPDGTVWRTAPTPCGPATLRVRRGSDGAVDACGWGPGASWMLDGVPALLGAEDDPSGFTAHHPLVASSLRSNRGLRLGRTGLVFDQVVPAILEQKVTGSASKRSWRYLVTRLGSPPPGPAPAGMRVAPYAPAWAAAPDWVWHRAGVEPAQRRRVRVAASVASRLDECASMPLDAAVARLRLVPGIGPWTAAEVAQRALGHPDEVSVGDFHLPALVGWALLGRPVDDDGMLALLAPYAPHRQRAMRLLELSGARKPRFGPRMSVPDFRSM